MPLADARGSLLWLFVRNHDHKGVVENLITRSET